MRRKVLAGVSFSGRSFFSVSPPLPILEPADAALISARLTLLIVLSILVVRERWRNRHELPGKAAPSDSDVGDWFLQRCRAGITVKKRNRTPPADLCKGRFLRRTFFSPLRFLRALCVSALSPFLFCPLQPELVRVC